MKSAGLVAPVCRPVCSTMDLLAPFDMQSQTVEPSEVDSSYRIFICIGFLQFREGDTEIPVTVLGDSGSMHTFVRKDILPFSSKSDTGSCVPCRGLAHQTLFVPVHKLFLSYGFFQKDVEVAVRAELPVKGVDVPLGSDLVPNGQMRPGDVRPFVKPQDVVQQTELACLPCPVTFGGVDVPVSLHSDVTDFTCGSSLKPAGSAVPGPAGAQRGLTPPESEMGPFVCAVTQAMAAALPDSEVVWTNRSGYLLCAQ